MSHWHYATGFAGYGPDGADGYSYGADVIDAARGLSDDLRNVHADACHQDAQGYADAGDYESAWKTRELSDALDVKGMCLDVDKRLSAPLYADDRPALVAMLTELLNSADRTPLDIHGNVLLYVWQCTEPNCEHVPTD